MDTWVDPLPWNVWQAMTDAERQQHVDERNRRQDAMLGEVAEYALHILFQRSGAFSGDYDINEFNEVRIPELVDLIFSPGFHEHALAQND